MRQLSSILLFYRPFMIWSFGINTLLAILEYDIVPFFLIKLFLVVFLWYIIKETHVKRKLIFYKNLGISTFKLFSFLYIIDLFLSIPFLLVLKEFI